jgi:hypothetical protein
MPPCRALRKPKKRTRKQEKEIARRVKDYDIYEIDEKKLVDYYEALEDLLVHEPTNDRERSRISFALYRYRQAKKEALRFYALDHTPELDSINDLYVYDCLTTPPKALMPQFGDPVGEIEPLIQKKGGESIEPKGVPGPAAAERVFQAPAKVQSNVKNEKMSKPMSVGEALRSTQD